MSDETRGCGAHVSVSVSVCEMTLEGVVWCLREQQEEVLSPDSHGDAGTREEVLSPDSHGDGGTREEVLSPDSHGDGGTREEGTTEDAETLKKLHEMKVNE